MKIKNHNEIRYMFKPEYTKQANNWIVGLRDSVNKIKKVKRLEAKKD
jgi:hypothetical protein